MLKVDERGPSAKKDKPAIRSFFDLGNAVAGFDPAKVLKNAFISLSAAEAGELLRHCRYSRQVRDLTAGGKAHARVLADIMKRGQWRPKDKLDFAVLNGKFILVNGHHRLTAQAASGVDIQWTVVLHECASEEDLSSLYCSFDTNLRVRSNANILAASDLAALIGIKPMAAEALWRAVPLIAANFDFGANARDPLVSRVIDSRMELCKAFQREAVALTTFRHAPKPADSFWRAVGDNDGLAKGDPRHTYLRTITEHSVKSGDAASTAWPAAICWNAFYAGRELLIVRPGMQANFRIAGTPVGRK